jgi:Family of unknown function (DUF6152)
MGRSASGSRLLAIAAWACPLGALSAHHSVLPYDNEKPTQLSGTVARILFANPHTVIVLDVERQDGGRERWTIESEGATILKQLGWEAGAIEAGDRIRALGARAKDGSLAMRCRSLDLENGRTLHCFPLK